MIDIGALTRTKYGPIGVDIGSRSVKLMQLSSDHRRLVDAVRWELPATAEEASDHQRAQQQAEALRLAREGRNFRRREVVLCVSSHELFVQNIRVSRSTGADLERLARQEAASRFPFPAAEAEIRILGGTEVRQADSVKREVIVLACHRPLLDQKLALVEAAELRPVAVDAEPLSLLRAYAQQFRRDEDRGARVMYVHVGWTKTLVVIAEGEAPLFMKYLDQGGQQFDASVAHHLKLSLADSASLRRHNGDRRIDQQDPEIARSIQEAMRGMIEKLAGELSMCIRYHNVTFRGQPLTRLVLGGGEATSQLLESLQARLDVKCEHSNPLRSFDLAVPSGRNGQWDIATGLALRELG